MSTMTISLPDTLPALIEELISTHGYGTSSEYVFELIRKDWDRRQLRTLLLEGASSEPSAPVSPQYFEGLRERVHKSR